MYDPQDTRSSQFDDDPYDQNLFGHCDIDPIFMNVSPGQPGSHSSQPSPSEQDEGLQSFIDNFENKDLNSNFDTYPSAQASHCDLHSSASKNISYFSQPSPSEQDDLILRFFSDYFFRDEGTSASLVNSSVQTDRLSESVSQHSIPESEDTRTSENQNSSNAQIDAPSKGKSQKRKCQPTKGNSQKKSRKEDESTRAEAESTPKLCLTEGFKLHELNNQDTADEMLEFLSRLVGIQESNFFETMSVRYVPEASEAVEINGGCNFKDTPIDIESNSRNKNKIKAKTIEIKQQKKNSRAKTTVRMYHDHLDIRKSFSAVVLLLARKGSSEDGQDGDWHIVHGAERRNIEIDIKKAHFKGERRKEGYFSIKLYDFCAKKLGLMASKARFKVLVPLIKFSDEEELIVARTNCPFFIFST